jgi:hypothetical protein
MLGNFNLDAASIKAGLMLENYILRFFRNAIPITYSKWLTCFSFSLKNDFVKNLMAYFPPSSSTNFYDLSLFYDFLSTKTEDATTTGVNFTNVLRAAFTYVSCTRSFLCLCFRFVLSWCKTVGPKAARRTLMKLSPDRTQDCQWLYCMFISSPSYSGRVNSIYLSWLAFKIDWLIDTFIHFNFNKIINNNKTENKIWRIMPKKGFHMIPYNVVQYNFNCCQK